MEQKKLIWARLKSDKCPKCNKILVHDKRNGIVECSDTVSCTFRIYNSTFEDLINKMYKRGVDMPSYKSIEVAKDLQKRECPFCHCVHNVSEKCEGFG